MSNKIFIWDIQKIGAGEKAKLKIYFARPYIDDLSGNGMNYVKVTIKPYV